MTVEFINHACLLIKQDAIQILCDPWIEGTVFNNGWKLITPTVFSYEDFANITHIWFSHEHPDHFFPPNLKKIPTTYRKQITVIFQETHDKRVMKFCQEAGFKTVIELQKDTWLKLSDNLEVLCELFTEGDSWICFRSGNETFLNTNDCWITKHSQAEYIKNKVGKVDILFNQFSYAFWAGNTDQPEIRQKIAKEKLASYQIECEVFAPKITIPIASFVWFCHEENYFLNDSINTVAMLYEFIQKNTTVTPVILFPADTYWLGKEHNSQIALEKWQLAYQKIQQNPVLTSNAKINLTELQNLANIYMSNLQKESNWVVKLLLRFLKKSAIYLSDYQQSFSLGLDGLKIQETPYQKCDIALSSDSLAFCLRFAYGMDTLGVNGRYQRPLEGNYSNFYTIFRIEQLKSRGTNIDLAYIVGAIGRKIAEKITK
jgi:UDP-MurNAc hydroxylase